MRARVKDNCVHSAIRSAGVIFSKYGWTYVPEWAQSEILANDLLEVEDVEVDIAPAIPKPVEKKSTKLVVTGKRRGIKL